MARDDLQTGHLMDAAVAATGLTDFGDPSFRELLALLVESLRGESKLNARGRQAAISMLVSKLELRLRIVDAHHRHPELGQSPVEAPIFIIGMPRVGSTLMHHLFGEDHTLRVPRRWELHKPLPPPEPSTYFSDPRIEEHNGEMAPLYVARPGLERMHPMRADFPEECVHLLTPAFASILYWVLFGAPQYQRALTQWDMRDPYRFHRMFLQLLQRRYPASPWVLKYPGHVGHLEALCDVYPDARFVWLHRDPVDVVSSVTNLVWIANGANRQQSDSVAVASRITKDYATRMRVSMDERRRLETPDRPWCDVLYDDFVADPVMCMRGIYRWAGLSLGENASARMQQYVDHPPYPRGGYTNDAGKLGIDKARIRQEFAEYTDEYLSHT